MSANVCAELENAGFHGRPARVRVLGSHDDRRVRLTASADGVSVAALMLIPSPAAEIQGFIDAVPVGTEHCTTVLPTEDPNRWSVDVLLKFPPLGTEGVHRQWITTASADGGLKIATVEDRK